MVPTVHKIGRQINSLESPSGAMAFWKAFYQEPGTEKAESSYNKQMIVSGLMNASPDLLQRALSIDNFEQIPVPGPGDWIAEHHESGQTFDDFIQSDHNSPDEIRNIIYLQLVG